MKTSKLLQPLAVACSIGLTVLLTAAGCGDSDEPSETKIESLVPESNEVSGWTEDTTVGAAGVEIGKTPTEVAAKIDGDVDPFAEKGFVGWARQHYTKSGYQLELRIWQMKDAATAATLYDDLATSVSLYSALAWTTLSVGEAGRIANSGTTWWANARKKAFHIEARISQKSAGDATARAEVETFLGAVAAKVL